MNIKKTTKKLLNKIGNDNDNNMEDKLSKVIEMMKQDGERYNQEYLLKYSELLEELLDMKDRNVKTYDNIYNLTSHEINILDEDNNEVLSIKPSDNLARVKKRIEEVETIFYNNKKIKVNKNTYDKIEDLPNPIENAAFIVSKRVSNEKPERDDLYFPEEIVYNEDGSVMGCRKLGQPSSK